MKQKKETIDDLIAEVTADMDEAFQESYHRWITQGARLNEFDFYGIHSESGVYGEDLIMKVLTYMEEIEEYTKCSELVILLSEYRDHFSERAKLLSVAEKIKAAREEVIRWNEEYYMELIPRVVLCSDFCSID